ncbi:MAG TPA: TlpA disulfide reductase family protein [Polyangiaceae bacterium]|nr:TlpA disulfide reductase family protein [Polyangiaceae bacterium]
MNTSTDTQEPKPGRSKLSKATDVVMYVGIAGLLGVLVTRGSSGPREGTAAKDFQLPLASGQGVFNLAAQRGSPVLVEVFASWCGACEHAAPMVDEVYREAQRSGVVFVGVSVDGDASAAQRVQQSWPISYPVAVDDGSVQRAYGVSLLPTFVLIDREGTVKRVSSGVPSRRTLSRWLAEL